MQTFYAILYLFMKSYRSPIQKDYIYFKQISTFFVTKNDIEDDLSDIRMLTLKVEFCN